MLHDQWVCMPYSDHSSYYITALCIFEEFVCPSVTAPSDTPAGILRAQLPGTGRTRLDIPVWGEGYC